MPNDQFGRPISVGDTVTLKGEVTKVLDDPNYINCTVQLAQQMPPSGAKTNVQCNTAQVEKTGGSKGGESKPQPPSGTEKPPELPPHGAKK